MLCNFLIRFYCSSDHIFNERRCDGFKLLIERVMLLRTLGSIMWCECVPERNDTINISSILKSIQREIAPVSM